MNDGIVNQNQILELLSLLGVRWRKGFAPDYTGRATFEKTFLKIRI
jgi:hypothetical protein